MVEAWEKQGGVRPSASWQAVTAIFPRGEGPSPQREKNAQASRLASKIADGKVVHYMDIDDRFLGPGGTLSEEIMPDLLHLSPRGYEIWAEALEGSLVELLDEKP